MSKYTFKHYTIEELVEQSKQAEEKHEAEEQEREDAYYAWSQLNWEWKYVGE